jgi:hypothetical protein
MHSGRTIFAQFLDYLPRRAFGRAVIRFGSHRRAPRFSYMDQFLAMAFAQLTGRDSLRDIENCLRSVGGKLYHCGFRGMPFRNTLAVANERRDWRVFADIASRLIAEARELYADESCGLDLDQTVYAFDSTTIDLCLSLFPWAKFRRRKSAVKLHTLLDLRGNIPAFVHVSGASMADVRALDLLSIEPGAIYVMDRGYIDFARLHRFTEGLAFFVVRAKRGMDFRRVSYRKLDKSTGLRSDTTIRLRGPKTSTRYPQRVRRIGFYARDIGKKLYLLTNNFTLPAETIALLYKKRWEVELFFKWIKQNLRIKRFFGTSANAVKTQVWIAVCVYVMAALVRKRLNLTRSLSEVLQILSISLFEQTPIQTALQADWPKSETNHAPNQLSLFKL